MNAPMQTLDNMRFDSPPTEALQRMAGADYVRDLPAGFWSPVFGQPRVSPEEAYNFDFERWRRHREARKMAMKIYLEYWLAQGGTVLESFSDTGPTADYTESEINGCEDVLWSVESIRRMDKHGSIRECEHTFIPECRTPAYLAEHLTNRIFGFNMRVATWLEASPPQD